MPDDSPQLSRSGETALFGKCDKPTTVYLSEETERHARATASLADVSLSEFLRILVEEKVWGTAEVMARMCQKRMPVGIRRTTAE